MNKMSYRELLEDVLSSHLDLTFGGFVVGDCRRISRAERDAETCRGREEMLTPQALDQFQRCYGWLARQPRTENINKRAGTSYSLKEEVEAESGYVSNGMFIAAALACGYLVEQADDSRNAWLNIKQIRASNPNLALSLPHPDAAKLLKQRGETTSLPGSGRQLRQRGSQLRWGR
jgi:hypothetical protein